MSARAQHYKTTVTTDSRKRVMVPVPFDPDKAWGRKPQHHVAGRVNGRGIRGVIERLGDGCGFTLGAIVPSRQRT